MGVVIYGAYSGDIHAYPRREDVRLAFWKIDIRACPHPGAVLISRAHGENILT